MIELMKNKATFVQSEIQDGDIVCFQTELSEQCVAAFPVEFGLATDALHRSLDLDKQNKIPNPPLFYDYFLNRLNVHFRPKIATDDPKAVEFDLMLSKKMTYDQVRCRSTSRFRLLCLTLAQMAMKVGDALKHDYAKLRFFSAHPQTQQPKAQLRRVAAHSVAEMVTSSFNQSGVNLLYYELLDIPLSELETKKQCRVTWMGVHNRDEVCRSADTLSRTESLTWNAQGSHTFLLPKTSTINDVAENLSRTAGVKLGENGGSGRIRVFDPQGGRRIKSYGGGEIIRDLHDTMDLFAEVR